VAVVAATAAAWPPMRVHQATLYETNHFAAFCMSTCSAPVDRALILNAHVTTAPDRQGLRVFG